MSTSDMISEAFKTGREQTPDELRTFYDDWAKKGDYDKIMVDAGYLGPKSIACYLANKKANNLMEEGAKILDIGAGTGLVGEELAKQGFSNVCALDPSQDSLDVCTKKGCYKEYFKNLVGPEKIPVEDNTFDGAVSSGTFVPGHCDGTSLKEVARVVKPGGVIVIATRRTFFDDVHPNFNFRQASDELVAAKICSLVQEDIQNYSQQKPGALFIYTVC